MRACIIPFFSKQSVQILDELLRDMCLDVCLEAYKQEYVTHAIAERTGAIVRSRAEQQVAPTPEQQPLHTGSRRSMYVFEATVLYCFSREY